MQIKKCISVLLASSFILPVLPAHAGEETVQLMSNGRYQTYSLPDDAQQVQLVETLAGNCSYNQNWGYDLGRREMWVMPLAPTRMPFCTLTALGGVWPEALAAGAE